jgi:MFS superfamily sulfate permease-like transporter
MKLPDQSDVQNKDLEKLNELITQVDWSSTSARERETFSMSMLTFELASQAKKITQAVSRARLSTLLVCLTFTVIMMFFDVQPGIILSVILALQMLFLGVSQLFEHGANNLVKNSEKATFDLVGSLAKRHPSKSTDEDIFIL